MNCESCNRSLHLARNELYSEGIAAIRENHRFRKLPTVLVDMIIDYAFSKTVDITWERKGRCKCRVCMGYNPSVVTDTSKKLFILMQTVENIVTR